MHMLIYLFFVQSVGELGFNIIFECVFGFVSFIFAFKRGVAVPYIIPLAWYHPRLQHNLLSGSFQHRILKKKCRATLKVIGIFVLCMLLQFPVM